jgi:hypothetical protein
MFANFFKELREKNSTNIDLKIRGQNNSEITLEKYFELFPNIEELFLERNKPLQLALTSENGVETLDIDISLQSDLKNDDYIKLILDESYLKEEKLEKNIIDEKRISVLRRIFKNRMRKIEENDQIF